TSRLCVILPRFLFFFLSPAPSPTPPYSLSLHDALPISLLCQAAWGLARDCWWTNTKLHLDNREHLCYNGCSVAALRSRLIKPIRSEEHTSELQSRFDLVCRLLLEKKKKHILSQCTSINT